MIPKAFEAVSQDPDVIAKLQAGSGQILRFFPFGAAPEKLVSTGMPYAVYQTISGYPINYLGAAKMRPKVDYFSLQIDVWGADQEEVMAAGVALANAFEKAGWYIDSYRGGSQDPQTKRWRFSFDVSTHQRR